jgi:hypothetical protein
MVWWVTGDDETPEELEARQKAQTEAAREALREADTEADAEKHHRRADKAEYLRQKLREQREADEQNR